MGTNVLPIVRLLFACDAASLDLADDKWVLKNPWSVVMLPEGATFPFRADEFSVYTQLSDGLGEFELSVELRHVQEDEIRRTVGWSKSVSAKFQRGGEMLPLESVFRFKNPAFPRSWPL